RIRINVGSSAMSDVTSWSDGFVSIWRKGSITVIYHSIYDNNTLLSSFKSGFEFTLLSHFIMELGVNYPPVLSIKGEPSGEISKFELIVPSHLPIRHRISDMLKITRFRISW